MRRRSVTHLQFQQANRSPLNAGMQTKREIGMHSKDHGRTAPARRNKQDFSIKM